ncbi:response regulator [Prosthecobacter sp.]|uniref:response regulator n=1 Tax=Prosthecobacter sp. TaxID=1965333 RepID=UPI00378487D6
MNTPAPSSSGGPGSALVRIFLLDDNSIDREACRRNLSRVEVVSYEFVEHNSVDGALDRVREWDPHCILLDYHLHDGNGLQFLESLSDIGGPRRYPVVMLTGTGNEKIAVEVMKTGAQDYLSKESLNPELLHRTIEGAIYRARTERLLEEQRIEMARLYLEAQDANTRKDQFLANLSHELRTPLTPVLTAVSQTDFTGATTQDFIETFAMIRRNIELEARLIDDMLDLTRISTGKLQIHARTIDLHEVLHYAAEACEAEREAKHIRLDWRLAGERILLSADAGRVQQVFWNLFKNAVKFTPAEGTITVSTHKHGGNVQIEVADTGIGLPVDNAEKIFDAFEQGSSEVTRRFGGLGLGLAISKALVTAHGGTIRATNRTGEPGAVFTVSLPLGQPQPPSQQPAQPAAPGSRQPSSSAAKAASILLVEDHADSAAVLSRMLASRGYQVQVATTVAEALDLAAAHPFDCLVSDLGLPDASGLELMKTLAASHPLPAIALSGYGMESDVQRSLAAGFKHHLTKPVDFQQILHVLQTLLG